MLTIAIVVVVSFFAITYNKEKQLNGTGTKVKSPILLCLTRYYKKLSNRTLPRFEEPKRNQTNLKLI